MFKRVVILIGVLCVAAILYWQFAPKQSAITVSDARAAPTGASGTMFMVSLKMQNGGGPVALTGVSSATGADARIMNPDQSGPLVIPGGAEAQLAMDGAHMMLSVPDGSFAEGAFQSIALLFDDGSEIAARVHRPQVADGATAMEHGLAHGVEVSPPPSITLKQPISVNAEGFSVEIGLEDFEFVVTADDAPHVPGQGHAHVYLNGLKLGRLYENSFDIGSLAAGVYRLRIGLNTNDHRPYVSDGAPVEAVFDFTIP